MQFMRLAIEDDLAAGRLNIVLPEIPLFTTPIQVLHAFGRQLPLRARLFIDFLVEALDVGREPVFAALKQACRLRRASAVRFDSPVGWLKPLGPADHGRM